MDIAGKLEMLQDNVLIKRDVGERISAGGIVLPETTKEYEQRCTGEIVAVGPGSYDYGVFVEPRVKKGDRVVYPMPSVGDTLTIDGAKHDIVCDDSIVARIV